MTREASRLCANCGIMQQHERFAPLYTWWITLGYSNTLNIFQNLFKGKRWLLLGVKYILIYSNHGKCGGGGDARGGDGWYYQA